ncbi:TPA: type 1 fimbrial protein, partial [Klebsiella pneumoniae]
IEYSVNVSQASINLDVSDLPIGSLLYSYGGMIITNNERWEIACSGSEPGGFQSIGGSRVGPAGDGKPGDIYSIDRLPGIGYSFQMGEQDGINFDPLFTAWPSAPVFSGQRAFQAENKKPTIYFWRIADNGGLPLPGEYCLNDYLGDIYLGGVQAMRFSVSGLCIQVKSPTCKITDDSKNINVFLGRHNKTAFTGLNSTTAPVPFNINLTNCENVGSVFMQFNATVDSAVAANEVIKIDDQPEGASGLGVQILSAGGSLVPLNQVSQVWSGKKGSQTNYRLSYQARYIQTQPAVTAGEANASATFVVTYN